MVRPPLRKRHPELEPRPELEPVGGWTSRAAQVTPLVRLRVCSPAGHAPSTSRLAFLLRPVAQRADCARLVPCCASTCRPATSDGGHRSRCGRCWWCRGWSPRSGCFRDRGWAGCARFDGPGCFSTPQLDKRSLGSARDGRFVLSSLFRARARHPTARATRTICAGGRGREKVALASKGEVANARAGAPGSS